MHEKNLDLTKVKINIKGTSDYASKISVDSISHVNIVSEKLLSEDSNVLDIGANIGFTSFAMAQHCPKGRVFSLEPHPNTFKQLSDNIIRNKANVECDMTPLNFGLSSYSGKFKFRDEDKYNTGNGIIADGAVIETLYNTIEVEIKNSEAFMHEYNINDIKFDLVKIDVEGHEIDVIKGFGEKINDFGCVLLEFNHWCLSMYRKMLPEEALNCICGKFKYVMHFKNRSFQPIETLSDRVRFLQANLIHNNVSDLACTNDIEVFKKLINS